jgi:L-histidine N-alpha-methyltransferase
MNIPTEESMVEVQAYIAEGARRETLMRDVRRGLTAESKSIPPTWFYDEVGSELFEDITRVPEYYPTRAEREILVARADEIVEISRADTLVELGSGSSEKTRVLLDAMVRADTLARVVPFDVSETMLVGAAEEINAAYDVPVVAVVGDFRQHLDKIPTEGHRLVIFLGGTIGNLAPGERARFLGDLEATMDQDDWLLIGTDLEKDVGRLVAAYDDAAGVTAAFNRNVLAVLNNELGADFDLESFEHVALWNDADRRIEMRLRATRGHTVAIPDLDLSIDFAEGEEILTEISSKFTRERIAEELAAAKFRLGGSWTDAAGDFLVTLAQPDR